MKASIFTQCLTMPAVCHYVFRRNFMKPNTIALIPPTGYNVETNSHKAILWLKFIAHKHQISIQHSRNSKEKHIFQYKVDGWDPVNKNVYEFHGCVYHGCPKCFSPSSFNTLKNETFENTFKKHKERLDKIKSSQEVNNVVESVNMKINFEMITNFLILCKMKKTLDLL